MELNTYIMRLHEIRILINTDFSDILDICLHSMNQTSACALISYPLPPALAYIKCTRACSLPTTINSTLLLPKNQQLHVRTRLLPHYNNLFRF